jgi:hypothetical protein
MIGGVACLVSNDTSAAERPRSSPGDLWIRELDRARSET